MHQLHLIVFGKVLPLRFLLDIMVRTEKSRKVLSQDCAVDTMSQMPKSLGKTFQTVVLDSLSSPTIKYNCIHQSDSTKSSIFSTMSSVHASIWRPEFASSCLEFLTTENA